MLQFYPQFEDRLEIRYVDFPRSGPELVDLLGEQNQSCPIVVVETVPPGIRSSCRLPQANSRTIVEGANKISEYLAHVDGIGIPH